MDRRRRQYVPMSVYLAQGKTGQKLLEEFGVEGIAVWACFLCACKTNWVQGQFTYASEADGWTKLGLYGYEPSFSLASFFAYTGRLKQTSRRASGRVQDVICTRWEEWSIEVGRELDADKKRSKRAQSTRTINGRNHDEAQTLEGTEVEGEDEERTRPRASPNGRAGALEKAGLLAATWAIPDSNLFAEQLDDIEHEHGITFRTLERETLWDTANAASANGHTTPAPTLKAPDFLPSGDPA